MLTVVIITKIDPPQETVAIDMLTVVIITRIDLPQETVAIDMLRVVIMTRIDLPQDLKNSCNRYVDSCNHHKN